MSDRYLFPVVRSTSGTATTSNPKRKGPNRAQFLDFQERRSIVRRFLVHGQSVAKIAASDRLGYLVVEDVIRHSLSATMERAA